MIIANLACGLGNQLFQYAMARRLAATLGVSLALDLNWFQGTPAVHGLEGFSRDYRLGAFDINARPVAAEEVAPFINGPVKKWTLRWVGHKLQRLRRHFPPLCRGTVVDELGHRFEPGLLNLPDGVYLYGWWQSEGYFRDQADLIRREFVLRDAALREQAAERVNFLRQDGRPVVAVHVRRGDVARAHEILADLTHMPYELVSTEYLHGAMTCFGPQANFLVFSDSPADIAWCRQQLRADNIHFADGNSDLLDFAMMSACDHNIISNSSFGWWAAWLNPNPEKVVVAPRRWFRRDYAPDYDIQTIVPKEWVLL